MYYYKKFWRNPLCHNFAKCDWLRPPCTVALTIITIIIFIYTKPFSFTCIRILPSIGFNHIYSCQETYISLRYLYFPIKKSKRFQRQWITLPLSGLALGKTGKMGKHQLVKWACLGSKHSSSLFNTPWASYMWCSNLDMVLACRFFHIVSATSGRRPPPTRSSTNPPARRRNQDL